MKDEQHSISHLVEVLRTFDTAMLVSSDVEGKRLRGRPMSLASVEDNGDLWFVTGIDSAKTDEMLRDPRVAVVFQGTVRFASVAGEGRLIADRGRAEELWRESWRPWFPEGPTDASLVIVHVVAHEAEFWDVSGLRGARYVLSAVRHVITGERMEDSDADHHRRVSLVSE